MNVIEAAKLISSHSLGWRPRMSRFVDGVERMLFVGSDGEVGVVGSWNPTTKRFNHNPLTLADLEAENWGEYLVE